MAVKIKTQDDKIVEIDLELAKKSTLLKNLIEDLGDDIDVIPVNNVSHEIFMKVIEYLKNPENSDYFRMDHEMMIAVILAANFLDMEEFLDRLCKEMAENIKDKSVDEIREIFDIPPPVPFC